VGSSSSSSSSSSTSLSSQVLPLLHVTGLSCAVAGRALHGYLHGGSSSSSSGGGDSAAANSSSADNSDILGQYRFRPRG
jgi:hypothetical protein